MSNDTPAGLLLDEAWKFLTGDNPALLNRVLMMVIGPPAIQL
jgi:hypothetical protein